MVTEPWTQWKVLCARQRHGGAPPAACLCGGSQLWLPQGSCPHGDTAPWEPRPVAPAWPVPTALRGRLVCPFAGGALSQSGDVQSQASCRPWTLSLGFSCESCRRGAGDVTGRTASMAGRAALGNCMAAGTPTLVPVNPSKTPPEITGTLGRARLIAAPAQLSVGFPGGNFCSPPHSPNFQPK